MGGHFLPTERSFLPGPEGRRALREAAVDTDPTFAEWMTRVRAGDEAAAADLIRRHEASVRAAVARRLTDPRLRRQFDSADVCQSVLASFFVRAAAGQFELNNPAQLVALLARMAQNKLGMQVRRHRTRARDVGREEPAAADAPPLADHEPGPERQAAGRDLLSKLLDRLGPEERELAQRRALGQGWADIAQDLGGTRRDTGCGCRGPSERLAGGLGWTNPRQWTSRLKAG